MMNQRLKFSLSRVLKRLREERNLTREEMAEKCQFDAQFLALAEDERRITLTSLITIAEVLQIRLSEIIRQAEEQQ